MESAAGTKEELRCIIAYVLQDTTSPTSWRTAFGWPARATTIKYMATSSTSRRSRFTLRFPLGHFDAWGIDVIGLIDPPSSGGHRFILAARDNFSKWVEAVPLREVKSDNIIKFLERNIIYRFGIPHRITSNNTKAFKSNKMYKFMEKYKIKWNYSTGYYPQANGVIEAFNKTLGKILKKTEGLTQDEQVQLCFQELNALEEERLHALQNLELYGQNMVRAYDKLVKQRVFRKGELVLVLRRPIVITHKTKGKFEPKWE
ncbi:uncharacterized protein [Aegilops tauschii subsp. strangulata]|uniref:uncharacterized protein n=1 Tax=Aegilops tauschii subsp. strangulata TaxID=200361 RepID=UPI003CC8D3E4